LEKYHLEACEGDERITLRFMLSIYVVRMRGWQNWFRILRHLYTTVTFENDHWVEDKGKGKDKVVPVLITEHHAMKVYWNTGGTPPRILDLTELKAGYKETLC